jgi:hypothetical protein
VVIGGQPCWTMSSRDYVKAAVANVEAALDASGQATTTFSVLDTDTIKLQAGIGYNSRTEPDGHAILSRTNWSAEMGGGAW